MTKTDPPVSPPAMPKASLSIGITGHRAAHPAYRANAERIETVIADIFDRIDAIIRDSLSASPGLEAARTRLTTLMVDGADQAAALLAEERGWELLGPLPFGPRLNLAINALPESAADARALLAGREPAEAEPRERARRIQELTGKARIFALADQDEHISELLLATLDDPQDFAAKQAFTQASSRRAALAGRIIIEQSDMVIAVWDGASTANLGGTGHTVARTLELGSPVLWIDPAEPEKWRFLHAPESLATLYTQPTSDRSATLETTIARVLSPGAPIEDDGPAKHGLAALYGIEWETESSASSHAYRRIETMFSGSGKPFGSIRQRYERPDEVAEGSGAELLAAATRLPGADPDLTGAIVKHALGNFAWADGISAKLSDRYRGGMVVSFLLSAIAIVGGVAYLPLVDPEQKWIFALFEFLVLLAIVVLTWRGVHYRWHGRWFETRRVAEYFRHSPYLSILGVARAPGRWPTGTETSWPEWVARHGLRRFGLPEATITSAFLRGYLDLLLRLHVVPQKDYHAGKARRLRAVHHNLDRFSELLFVLAIISVATYLLLKGASLAGLVDPALVSKTSKWFTVLGVLFPTFGAAIAGIRYFGDFERFAAISDVTYHRLASIADRIALLQSAPDDEIDYCRVAELAHATDEVVVSEIEAWQAVFSGKHITVPV